MKFFRVVPVLSVLLLIGGAGTAAEKTTGNPAWEKMKSLAGDWSGDTPEGKVQISYRFVSAGNALLETIREPEGSDMLTVYHLDGSRIQMTHYCSMGNQPRMRADVPSGDVKKIPFSYVDATNLRSPEDPHMSRLVVTFDDPDHLTMEWTASEKGKESTSAFKLTRKK